MAAQLEVYNETQEELTSELADFKEKYREIVNLLHDTQEELKKTKKRTYSGVGTHKLSEMFSASPDVKGKGNSPLCYLYIKNKVIKKDLKRFAEGIFELFF